MKWTAKRLRGKRVYRLLAILQTCTVHSFC